MNRYTQEYLQQLSKIVETNIDKVWEIFGVSLNKFHNYYSGTCPIHLGDNPTAFQFMMNSEGVYNRCRWRCYTHSCHETYKDTTIGLIRALLSRSREASFSQAVEWIEEKFKVTKIELPEIALPILDFKIPEPKMQLTREEIRAKINIPSRYFVNRGFSPSLLDFHDVGPLKKPELGLYYREIVPVYDITGKICIGGTCRSTFEACKKCDSHHDPKRACPKKELLSVYCKWKNWQFRKAFSLYNYWWATPSLRKTKKAILTEGPGDTWAIKRIGIENVVSAYGRTLNVSQLHLLQNLDVTDLYIAFDNDLPGIEGFKAIGKRFWQDINIHKINIPECFHDIGEIPDDTLYGIMRKEYECK